MPSTFDKTSGAAGFPWDGITKPVVLKQRISMVGVTTGSGDTVKCLNVPAGFYCQGVAVKVITPSVAGNAVDVGDGDDVDGYIVDVDFTAAAGWRVPAAGAYVSPGKLYAVADTIDLVPNADIAGAIFEIYAFGFNLSY